MIYLLAILFSLIVSFQCFASEITAGNIKHIKNGRQPNAGAALFPVTPLFQLLAVGAAWLLDTFMHRYAIWVLIGSFLTLSVFWTCSFIKLKTEFDRIKQP